MRYLFSAGHRGLSHPVCAQDNNPADLTTSENSEAMPLIAAELVAMAVKFGGPTFVMLYASLALGQVGVAVGSGLDVHSVSESGGPARSPSKPSAGVQAPNTRESD